jgi:hypothetical protein
VQKLFILSGTLLYDKKYFPSGYEVKRMPVAEMQSWLLVFFSFVKEPG